MSTTPVIELKNVDFSYAPGVPLVLENVSIRIELGESVCIIGPNGGGKTTLLRLMLGMLQPTQGTVSVLDKPAAQSVQSVGYMPQSLNFDPLFPITVLEVVLMGRLGVNGRVRGRYSDHDRSIARTSLSTLDLSGFEEKKFSALSGGQRQRVLIARALASEPKILLLDEPTANIDWKIEHQLLEALSRLREKLTVVIVSHDLAFVSALVDKVICVNRRVALHHKHAMCDPVLEELYGHPLQHVHHCEHGHTRNPFQVP
jgi:zinc transport system ATP-binding protein